MKNKIPTITVAMTGASGAIYAFTLIRQLLDANCRVFFLYSAAARIVIETELELSLPEEKQAVYEELLKLFSTTTEKFNLFSHHEWTAPVASGSNPAKSMVIVPCSMGTLSAIAAGASNNLIERAADVAIKEKKQLILLTREMPLSVIHMENMLKLGNMGVTIMPASPGFYHIPTSVDDLVNFVVARILDHLDVPHSLMTRWGD